MEIKRNASIEQWALEEVQNNWGSETREGIHLSDLLAPRKKFWQTIKPMKPTIEEISYWTSGSAIEAKFLSAIGYEHGETKEWNGILYSPDSFFNFPAEIKSRRRNLAEEGKEPETYEWYLKQLRGYCALANKQKGWLIILSLLEKRDENKTSPEWAYYDVTFTQEEIESERVVLLSTKSFLEKALKENNIKLLIPCPKWMCGTELKNMVKKPFCKTCNKEFETDWGINKHITSKTGAGHITTQAEYEINFEKRCKWFDDCKPF